MNNCIGKLCHSKEKRMWDSGAAGDYNTLEEEEEAENVTSGDANEELNLDETNTDCFSAPDADIRKSFHVLEEHCFIDHVDVDQEFIVIAGKDHDIKIWRSGLECFCKRLTGHTGPITGLKLQAAPSTKGQAKDRTVVSASEDGSIREWSILEGIEIRKIQTKDIITCMDLLTNTLAATGNNKGMLEVHSLPTGETYTSCAAHDDPIDALQVNDVYICTAVYDRPGHLRVWQVKRGKLSCVYNLQDTHNLEFACLAACGDLLVLGESCQQVLHVLSFSTEDGDALRLEDVPGRVQDVRCTDDLILASTLDGEGIVRLHVYQLHNLDHLGTFKCDGFDRLSAVALCKNQSTLKFVLGGSALAILKLEITPKKMDTGQDGEEKTKPVESEEAQEKEPLKDNIDMDIQEVDSQLSKLKITGATFQRDKFTRIPLKIKLPPIRKNNEVIEQEVTERRTLEVHQNIKTESPIIYIENDEIIIASSSESDDEDENSDDSQYSSTEEFRKRNMVSRHRTKSAPLPYTSEDYFQPKFLSVSDEELSGIKKNGENENNENSKVRKKCHIHGDAAQEQPSNQNSTNDKKDKTGKMKKRSWFKLHKNKRKPASDQKKERGCKVM